MPSSGTTIESTAGNNPFGLVYTGLWDMVLRSPALQALIRPGNRIRFDDADRGPQKETVQVGDMPELVLIGENVSGLLVGSSDGSQCKRTYSFVLNSGDYRVDRLYPAEWALWCAMAGWKESLARLIWPTGSAYHFVKRMELLGGTAGESDAEQARNLRGWTAVWRCEVEMWFRTADLKKELQDGSA